MNPLVLPATAPVDVPAWQQTVLAFLAEEAQARAPVERQRLTPVQIVDYLRSLPSLWADSGPDARQAIVTAMFARLDVLGFQRLDTSSRRTRSTSDSTRRSRRLSSSTARLLSLVGARGIAPP